jgi:hypothetical protein
MDLRFEGDLALWQGVLMAGALGATIWSLYRREVSPPHGAWMRWLLPTLRSAAIALIILMLTGPVLHGQVEIGDLGRVLVFVDESQSMGLTDQGMSPERKLVSARRLGWLSDRDFDVSLHEAATFLGGAQQLAPSLDDLLSELAGPDAVTLPKTVVERIDSVAERLRQITRAALDAVRAAPSDHLHQLGPEGDDQDASTEGSRHAEGASRAAAGPSIVIRSFEKQLAEPADQIAKARGSDSGTQRGRASDLRALVVVADRWERRLGQAFSTQVASVIERGDAPVKQAIERFDQCTRWQRVQSTLLRDDTALVAALREKHHVELLTTSGTGSADPRRLWGPHGSLHPPQALDPESPGGAVTNLVSGVAARVAEHKSDEPLAVVLFSDGQHNATSKDVGSPLEMARLLRTRGVPIFTVGVGDETPPHDLAVVAVQAPESVFADDRVKGTILIKDDMPAGHPLRIKIQVDGDLVWQIGRTTANERNRRIDFDFPVKDLVQSRLSQSGNLNGGANALSLPLKMNVSIDSVEGEVRDDNNSSEFHVRAITRPRRLLIIDGRPRWEYRYVRNLFERDKHWQVNGLLVNGAEGNRPSLPRGTRIGTFPDTREELFTYDLIIFGEVPRAAFSSDELEWMNQFVASRGGGLVFVDGQRGRLREYHGTPLEPLLPIEWTGEQSTPRLHPVTGLSLTTMGRANAALHIAGESSDSAELWGQLPPPRWLAPAKALPGSETFVEASHGSTDSQSPAVVLRRFGAGNVLYSALDESWRWRYEVADQYHGKYWNQVANWVMEPPYAVHDRFVSIDTGGFTYQKGEKAELQVRLRDEQGLPVLEATAEAVLVADDKPGEIVTTIPLTADANAGGVFRGSTDKLNAGVYQVAVRATGFRSEQLTARAKFVVLGDPSGEMNALSCDEELLRQVASLSGGEYLREEDAATLPARLAPFSKGHIEQRELVLWRSWYWFTPLVALFTTEWLVRRKAGLI